MVSAPGAPCPACRAAATASAGYAAHDYEGYAPADTAFTVMRCAACASLFLDPPPSPAQTAAFYSADYMSTAATGGFFAGMRALWDGTTAKSFARRAGAQAAILDYGCGDGGFVRRLREAGCTDVTGYDPMARDEDLAGGIVRDLAALTASGRRFDVIRMCNVIEHLAEPEVTMAQLHALLADGGVVEGETANGAHASSRWFGSLWGYLHYPYHTVMFSPEGLAEAAARWGYSRAETFDTLAPGSWSLTMEHALKAATRSDARGHVPLYPAMVLLSAPAVALDALLPGRTTAMGFRLTR